MAPSSSLQIPNADGRPSTSRPVSAAVGGQPTGGSAGGSGAGAAQQQSSRKQRASHQVGGSTSSSTAAEQQQQAQAQANAQYTDVYSHPAAIAYAAAHPRRQIPKFGPYLLLQTLGEGEFGKVKLGLHCQWGEEVAVKLIRRGSVDNSVRMSKVEREIEVLRTLKHPNIVRLYDVIETDKYIGIVIEYASGGELFDHILAHRYLKERDAAKLFSQLVSGVWYIHQKKIVHRDLKLENLLLDRHRNVIITDFGFANKFEHRADELMQTSCGSPCYAAPELVISEGLYVGSAVDIWSCGVILYAMLAGYLPFDDDPANPDGDNINLLYKYIVNTPLSFPEYVSESARDLLKIMLVPDPARRASLVNVMKHPWLAAYNLPPTEGVDTGIAGKPTAFGRTVEELERIAMEQHQAKRRAYQMQMKAAMAQAHQAAPIAPSASSPAVGGRSGHSSHRTDSGYAPSAGVSSPRTRSIQHQQQDYLYESAPIDQSVSSPAGFGSGGAEPATGYEMLVDDPFAPASGVGGGVVSPPATAEETTSPSKKKHHHQASGRHTIQLEYDESRAGAGREKKRERGEDVNGGAGGKRARSRSGSRSRHPQRDQNQTPSSPPLPTPNGGAGVSSPISPPKKRRPSQASESGIHIHKPLPPSPPQSQIHPRRANSSASPSSSPTTSRIAPAFIPPPVTTTETVHGSAPNITFGGTPPDTPVMFAKSEAALANALEEGGGDKEGAVQHKGSREGSASQSSSTRHRRGASAALGLGGLAKIFGGGSGSSNPNEQAPSISTHASESSTTTAGEKTDTEGVVSPTGTGKKSRRATLTVVVDTIKNRTTKGRNTPLPHESSFSAVEYPSSSSVIPKSAVLPPTTAPVFHPDAAGVGVVEPVTPAPHHRGASTLGASTNKARGVMQWFRAKSKGRDSVGGVGGGGEPSTPLITSSTITTGGQPTPTTASYRRKNSASTTTVNATSPSSALSTSSPFVQVLNVPATQQTKSPIESSVTPSFITKFRNSVTVGSSSSSSSQKASSSSISKVVGGTPLRIHHGAVDQNMITTRPPLEAFKHVREILVGMGLEIQVEGEFKFRCVRVKRAKPGGSVKGGGSLGSVPGTAGVAAFQMVGSAASNGVDKRGLPLPSHASFGSTGGMLRGLLMRRQSSHVSSGGNVSNSTSASASQTFNTNAAAADDDGLLTPDNSILTQPSINIGFGSGEPVYGELAEDAGDEVRFSVELTRIDRLNDTYSLDIRRLKGNLRSYKFLYDTIRDRANLA